MNTIPLVSIICPVFNAAHWIKKGHLNNVFNQTYKHWELILVDDGSTDETFELLKHHEREDSRVRILRQENGGGGVARNTGFEVAQGEFVYFFDIDDALEPMLLEYCIQQMSIYALDMMTFSYEVVIEGKQTTCENVLFPRIKLESNEQIKQHFFKDIVAVRHGNGFVWNKFYRRSFLTQNNAMFPAQRIQEDEVFNLQLYPLVQRMMMTDKVLYHYYIRKTGNVQSRFFPNLFEMFVNVRDCYEHLMKTWLKGDALDEVNHNIQSHINKKFYREIDMVLRSNLLHPNGLWTDKEKREEMSRVMCHPFTQETIQQMRDSLDLESRLYLHAYEHKNLGALISLVWVFSLLRKLKKLIR